MPKQTFTINDFSGGANGYIDPLDIADNELAQCQGFKPEPGTVIVLGDMKGAYTPAADSSGAKIEPGYGLFAFAHDYDHDGDLGQTEYLVLMDNTLFDIYSTSEGDWVNNGLTMGTSASDNSFAGSVKPCFFVAEGAFRVSPGNHEAKDSVGGMAASFAGTIIHGATEAVTATSDLTDYISAGDTIVINGQEMVALIVAATTLTAARNMTGTFPSGTVHGTDDTVNVVLETRWRGVVKRRNFANVTLNATFADWYSTYAHPRPPLSYAHIGGTTFAAVDSNPDTITDSGNGFITAGFVAGMGIAVTGSGEAANNTTHIVDTVAAGTLTLSAASSLTANSAGDTWSISTNIDHDSITDHTMFPFLVKYDVGNITVDGNQAPVMHVGYYAAEDHDDATWDDAIINLYTTALYDEVKQESQPNKYGTAITVAAGKEFGVWIGIEYADSAGAANYRFNKRATGARLYYEDTTGDPGILYQLLEIDFEKGAKKAEAQTFTDWTGINSNITCGSPYYDAHGSTATERTTDKKNAFIFVSPPKAFTYEFNTGYPSDVNTHARYKTAVVAGGRLFAGNIWQSGRAHGDLMIGSPVHKYDILPRTEPYATRVAAGDGDEIIKLEAYADRILQFKKRALYIVNISGGLGEEFPESEHKNMGVENPSQTCMTEYGVAWVNSRGVFLYDGQEITDLTLNKLQATNTTDRARALNVTESYIPLIGYHPDNKWLIIHPISTLDTNFEGEAWIHDFKNGSWTYSQEFSASASQSEDADYKTNMVWTADNNLVFGAGTSSNAPNFFKYRDAGTATPAQDLLILRTKDFHLDAPGVKKKLKSVYVTYSANGSTEIQAHILYQKASGTATEESEMEEMDGGTTYYTETDGFKTTSNAVYTVELKPSTTVTDALSFQFQLKNDDAVALAGGNFKLYNVSFAYRPLGVR